MRIEQINKFMPEFETNNDKKYKLETIWDSAVYAKKIDKELPELHYLVIWRSHLKEKNTYKSSSAIIQLWKMVNIFYKDYSEKVTIISAPFNSVPLITKVIVKLFTKREQRCSTLGLCSIYGKTNIQTFCKVKIKTFSKRYHKMY